MKNSNLFKHIKLKGSFVIFFVLGSITISLAQISPPASRTITHTQKNKVVTPTSRNLQLEKTLSHFFATHQQEVNEMKKNNPSKYEKLLIDAKKIANLEMDLSIVRKTYPDKVAGIEAELQALKALYNL